MIAVNEYTISEIYDGEKGDSGVSVVRVVPEYTVSTSQTSLPLNPTWEETKPSTVDSTHYLWSRQRTDLSNNTHTYSDAVCDVVINGIILDVNTNTQSITNKVWESDITTKINQYDGSTVNNIRDRVTQTETDISGITTRVSDVESETDDLGTRLESAESSITQNANNILLKVDKNGVISSINQSSEQITIDASKVDLVGNVTFSMLDSNTQNTITSITPELIVGTHGTTATATWTGTSTKLSSIQSGTRIQFKMTSAGASNVTLNLTLNNGTTTGAKPVYYNNTTRLGTQYGINAVIDLIYDGSAWRITNPYTNNNTVGSYGATSLVAGTGTIRQYSLIMRTENDTWSSFTTTSGTDTNKTKNTNGFILSDLYYMASSSNYAAGKKCSTCYESYSFNFCYSANCGSTLVAGEKVYIVGEINSNNGLFYLDNTWWTQTEPTTDDGKTYVYVGVASSTTNVYLNTRNPAYQFYNGNFLTIEEIRAIKAQADASAANLWINQSGQLAKDIIDNWATNATSSTTTIKGGLIQTNTITSSQLATDAIMSNNYQAGSSGSHYSTSGSFLDLSNGNFYTPYFESTSNGAYINGAIVATSLTIANGAYVEGIPTTDVMNSAISDAVDNIEIGGKNMLTGTNSVVELTTTGKWVDHTWRKSGSGTGTITSITVSDVPDKSIKVGWQFDVTSVTGTQYSRSVCIGQNTVKVVAGETYTMSCYAKGDGLLYMFYGISGYAPSDGSGKIAVTSSWKKYSVTFVAASSTTCVNENGTNVFFGFSGTDITGYICGMRLEHGSKATAYSPAPEDTNYYFFADSTGAHIATVGNNCDSGYNSLWTSSGLLLRNNTNNLATFTSSAVQFYDGSGNNDSNILAKFGISGIEIGKEAATKITLNTVDGLQIGNQISIQPNGSATLNSIELESGKIAGLDIQKVTSIEDQYPLFSAGKITATNSTDIAVNDDTHIVTVINDTTVTYTFSAKYSDQIASAIYYSPILVIAEDESSEEPESEIEPGEDTVNASSSTTTQSEDMNIMVTIKYLNSSGTVVTDGEETYFSMYLENDVWSYPLNSSLLRVATNVEVSFTLLEDATISLSVSYGINSGLMYNTTKLLGADDSPSIYVGTDGISVNDKIALLPTGTIMTNYIEVRGKGMELIESDAERSITLRNLAYDENKTYTKNGVYPHSVSIYGGNSLSRVAIGLYDRRRGNAVWRYDDHLNLFRIEKRTVLYNQIVPNKNNSYYIGTTTYRFHAAYINAIQIGLANYASSAASIFSKWRDGAVHALITRDTDGLSSYFGWTGNSSTDTVYHSNTVVRGYTVTLQSNGGGIALNGGVTASSYIKADYLYAGKTSGGDDGSPGWFFSQAGLAHVSREGAPAIYFHYNKAAAYTNYLAEASSGTLRVQKNFDVVSALTGGSISSDSTVSAGSVTSYTLSYTEAQTPSSYRCVVSAGICSFSYVGAAVAHAAGASLGTLPAGARPSADMYTPFVKMSGGVVGTVKITSGGAITVGQISNTSNTGRIYFNCTFSVV